MEKEFVFVFYNSEHEVEGLFENEEDIYYFLQEIFMDSIYFRDNFDDLNAFIDNYDWERFSIFNRGEKIVDTLTPIMI